MNRQERTDRLLDALIEQAMPEVLDRIDREYEELEAQQEPFEFSEEHKAAMQKIFRMADRRQRMAKAARYAKRAAIVLLAFVLVSGIAVMSTEAWRIKIFNYVFSGGDDATMVKPVEIRGDNTFGDITLTFIPEGFKLTQNQQTRNGEMVRFEKDNFYFILEHRLTESAFLVDTEDAVKEQITINGNDAMLYQKSDGNTLTWHDGNHSFWLFGNIPLEDLVKIGQYLQI